MFSTSPAFISKTLAVSSAMVIVGLVAFSPALAQTASPLSVPVGLRQNQGKLAARCDAVEQRLDTRITAFNNNKGRHIEQHKKMVDRFQKLMAELTTKGYDVSKLEADAKVLNEKIKKFGTDYQAFIDQLKIARLYPCGESEGKFRDEMKKTRDLLQTVQQDSLDVRSYYQTTIRPDIQAVRAQKS